MSGAELRGVVVKLVGRMERGREFSWEVGNLSPGESSSVEVPLVPPRKGATPAVRVTEVVNTTGKVREHSTTLFLGVDNPLSSLLSLKNVSEADVEDLVVVKDVGAWNLSSEADEPSVSTGTVSLSDGLATWTVGRLTPGKAERGLLKGTKRLSSIQAVKVGSVVATYVVWRSGGDSPSNAAPEGNLRVESATSSAGPLEVVNSRVGRERLKIKGGRFVVAKMSARRELLSVRAAAPDVVEMTVQHLVTNTGTAPLDELEVVATLAAGVEPPGPEEVVVFLKGERLGTENYEYRVETVEGGGNTIRVTFRDLHGTVGGFQPMEDLQVLYPAFVRLDPSALLFSAPMHAFALTKPPGKLLEARVTDFSADDVKLYQPGERVADDALSSKEFSFEKRIVDKLAAQATKAYNERDFDAAVEYCAQIVEVARRSGHVSLVEKYSKVLERLQQVRAFFEDKKKRVESEGGGGGDGGEGGDAKNNAEPRVDPNNEGKGEKDDERTRL
ncbi:MAG: hypothetical protein Kow0069_24420 [Promethearchaeota archaeon]